MTKKQSAKPARVFGGCLALGLLTSAVFAAGVTPATATQVATPSPIVGDKPATAGDGAVSYAINLAENTSDANFALVKYLVTQAGGAVTQPWPEIRTYFAQSKSDTFASDFAKLAKEKNIQLVSAGPTRQSEIPEYEQIPLPDLKKGTTVVAPTKPTSSTSTDDDAAKTTGTTPVDSTTDNTAKISGVAPDESAAAQEATTSTKESGGQQALASKGFASRNTATSAADPLSDQLWGHKAIGALKAYDVDTYYAPVTVGVIDSGVDSDHPDLAPVVDKSLSVDCTVNGIPSQQDERWRPLDQESHGTHVAGTIAAAYNGVGIQGVNPRAKIAGIRVYHGDFAMPEHVVCGFMWSGQKKIDITNNSYYVDPWDYWLVNEPSQAAGYESVRRAVKWSQDQGVLHFAAAGNSNQDLENVTEGEGPGDVFDAEPRFFEPEDIPVDLPNQLPGVISVSAVNLPTPKADPATTKLVRAGFSNYGKNSIDVAAPGVGILSTVYGNTWQKFDGTSMASPHAAAVASLIKSTHPGITSDSVVQLLKKHAAANYSRLQEDIEGNEYRGSGLVDALAAVTKDQPKPQIAEQVEYSTDGGTTWQEAGNSNILAQANTKLKLRFKASGLVSSAVLQDGDKVLDTKTTAVRSATGDTLYAETEVDVSDSTLALSYTLQAFGYNNSALADDDVTADFAYTIVPVAATPTPVTPITSADTTKAAAAGKLANTGADGAIAPLLSGTVFALLGAGALTLAARRRTKV
ncbi:S8 family serine peptidase [Canibacter sp. lx-45]|uniref:S8 family serine peptidase n=1 Tax=Canibacter zhuwentaonis TaxID=2837491 RepID=UPI001BDD5756|nr:S8 family serine peptidase [Canibacter zhuwentaonis]MBT1035549.1 S8 family serine peptidase [Canibacter zhuwentaonis]